ncbi:dihydrofolate reductase family protein [Chelativorans sp. YIM 93263]|uniref:dihydrofolate reductase family protein n=1 Tax=Chelativorans sp. YIM 93263 TaxID=2906648 RepID=UPI0023785A20|nr:dihydrofolate reductase family protein [Chelativorans sp. YIM 93263]
MRKIVTGAMMSLDGVMQAPGGPDEDPTGGFRYGGWVYPHSDEQFGEFIINRIFGEPFDLLLGRKTYDIFAAYWPYVEAGHPIGSVFNSVLKYVATHNPDLELTWPESRSLAPDAVEAVRKLKAENGPNLVTQGSTDLLQSLLRNDLIDELYLTIFPIVLGKGKKLFGAGAMPMGFKLVSSKVSDTGIIMTKYERAGAVETGSFGMEEPTEAELERRRNLT